MPQEIERKFLVKGDFMPEVYKAEHIVQGYLNSAKERTVRVRILYDKGFITIKGEPAENSFSHFEWEKEIPVEEAKELLKFAEPTPIEKTRHLIKNTDGAHIWEVDVFHGANEGLILAEIELGSEDETFDRPDWLGEDVTYDERYYNAYLSQHPFTFWPR